MRLHRHDPVNELGMSETRVPVHVEPADYRGTMGTFNFRLLLLLEEKLYAFRIDETVAPAVKTGDKGVF